MVVPPLPQTGVFPYSAGYRSVERVMRNGAIFIGNLAAMEVWYAQVRRLLMASTAHGAACLEGVLRLLAAARQERLKRLDELVAKVVAEDRSDMAAPLRAEHEALGMRWPMARARLVAAGDVACAEKTAFLAAWNAAQESAYVAQVQGLPVSAKVAGTAWLQRIVESVSWSA